MCDQQSLRPACAYAQPDQSLCLSLEYSMIVKLLTERHLEFLSITGGCRGPSESTLVKMSNCWKSRALAHISSAWIYYPCTCNTILSTQNNNLCVRSNNPFTIFIYPYVRDVLKKIPPSNDDFNVDRLIICAYGLLSRSYGLSGRVFGKLFREQGL